MLRPQSMEEALELTMKIYLAGPEVFFPDAVEIGRAKKEICAHHGFDGHYPLDNEVALSPTPACGLEIGRLNLRLIEEYDAIIANLTPFRGVSADPGTVFELGFAAGLGKIVHGYSTDTQSYRDRVHAAGFTGTPDATHDREGYLVEDFQLADNLMIESAIQRRGGIFLRQAGDNLRLFERLVQEIRAL